LKLYKTTKYKKLTDNQKQQKYKIYKVSNKKQITTTKFQVTEADYTKQILIKHYVEYKNTFDRFVNKYNIRSGNINLITAFKNELGKAQPVTGG
jgi:hypothetical protein